jgi:uncharacterized membrane protein
VEAAAVSVVAAADSPAAALQEVGRKTDMRWIKHLAAGSRVKRLFPSSALQAVHKAIAAGEERHSGQLCFAIENSLPLRELARNRTSRERAHEVFSQLRVWDTEHNSGVLIYVLLAERAIEIVADRGVAQRVDQSEWQTVCDRMRDRFTNDAYEQGAIEGIHTVSDILAKHFPPGQGKRANELSDAPFIL